MNRFQISTVDGEHHHRPDANGVPNNCAGEVQLSAYNLLSYPQNTNAKHLSSNVAETDSHHNRKISFVQLTRYVTFSE